MQVAPSHLNVDGHWGSPEQAMASHRRFVALHVAPVWQGLLTLHPATQSLSPPQAHARGSQIIGAHSASVEQVLGRALQTPQVGGVSGARQNALSKQSALLEQQAGSGHGFNGHGVSREPLGWHPE